MRVMIRLAVLVTLVAAVGVFGTRESTSETVTGHILYSLSFAGFHFILAGIVFTVMRLFQGGSIRDRFAEQGTGLFAISVLIAVVALLPLATGQ